MLFLPLLMLWIRTPMQFPTNARWGLGMVLAAACAMLLPSHPTSADVLLVTAPVEIHREGTRIHIHGTIGRVSRRWMFHSHDGQHSYVVLENHTLERLASAYKDDPADCKWKVSGELTEFFDDNYLLIQRAERSSDGVEEPRSESSQGPSINEPASNDYSMPQDDGPTPTSGY